MTDQNFIISQLNKRENNACSPDKTNTSALVHPSKNLCDIQLRLKLISHIKVNMTLRFENFLQKENKVQATELKQKKTFKNEIELLSFTEGHTCGGAGPKIANLIDINTA
jgi:hypothetical protein